MHRYYTLERFQLCRVVTLLEDARILSLISVVTSEALDIRLDSQLLEKQRGFK